MCSIASAPPFDRPQVATRLRWSMLRVPRNVPSPRKVRDAAQVGGRLFLLGERGLQLTDAQGAHVVDSACVAARLHLAPAGRHLVMVGEKTLQVVDATPFVAGAAAAAPHP